MEVRTPRGRVLLCQGPGVLRTPSPSPCPPFKATSPHFPPFPPSFPICPIYPICPRRVCGLGDFGFGYSGGGKWGFIIRSH